MTGHNFNAPVCRTTLFLKLIGRHAFTLRGCREVAGQRRISFSLGRNLLLSKILVIERIGRDSELLFETPLELTG